MSRNKWQDLSLDLAVHISDLAYDDGFLTRNSNFDNFDKSVRKCIFLQIKESECHKHISWTNMSIKEGENKGLMLIFFFGHIVVQT